MPEAKRTSRQSASEESAAKQRRVEESDEGAASGDAGAPPPSTMDSADEDDEIVSSCCPLHIPQARFHKSASHETGFPPPPPPATLLGSSTNATYHLYPYIYDAHAGSTPQRTAPTSPAPLQSETDVSLRR